MRAWATIRVNIAIGMKGGVIVASALSVVALVLGLTKALVSGIDLITLFRTLSLVVGLYLLGGVLGGILVGILLPLGKRLIGKILLGMAGVAPVYFFGYLMVSYLEGNMEMPDSGLMVIASIIGGFAGFVWWFTDRRETGDSP